ncbi:MAG: hypothetical protein ABUK11_04755 [Mariprofundaceae bacterium]
MKKQIISFIAILALAMPLAAQAEPELSLGGQYRINSYLLNDADGAGSVAAARVRIRQNIDLKFSDAFDTHLQINFGHITEGIGNHTGNNVGIRHAVMNYHFSEAATLTAGLVPLSDKFGDTLFSGDWDFNPVTFALSGNVGGTDYRLGWFKILEGTEGTTIKNDVTGFLVDLGGELGDVSIGAMGLGLRTPNAGNTDYENNGWIGGRIATEFDGIRIGADVVASNVKKNAPNVTNSVTDSKGIQARLHAEGQFNGISMSILGLYSTGKAAGEGYLSPQQIYGGQGYWGKTGVLNIQGPTDAGMDANMLRPGNNGYGLQSVQVGLGYSFTDELSGYLGAGYYNAGKERVAGQGKNIGSDVYVQARYAFPDSPLALEVFGDFASLGAAHYNSGGASRTVTAFGSRLQAEF